MKKIAIILFNLGGPDSLKSVKPFLFNLFNDKWIINLPQPFRYLLAKYISITRAPYSRKIYEKIGGRSPILQETIMQKLALEEKLGNNYKVFVAMRHWHPFIEEVTEEIKSYAPSEIILLPLYPQFSTTTTLSFVKSIQRILKLPMRLVCCYYNHPLFIQAQVEKILSYYKQASTKGKPIILFSAHGLPKRIITKGDPYQWQVETTVRLITEVIGTQLDWSICYQSKVGNAEWLSPDTKEEVQKYKDRPIVLVPITFVSEHSETLVELDIDYKSLAPDYYRVPTLRDEAKFIDCLVDICTNTYINACPKQFKFCPYNFQ